jgi:hypothetical protein
MIANSELFLEILRVSLTVAALTIPSISLAYFIISRSNDEITRMAKVISYGSIAAIILVICAISSFIILCLGLEDTPYLLLIIGLIFIFGCSLIIFIILILAGIKQELPHV